MQLFAGLPQSHHTVHLLSHQINFAQLLHQPVQCKIQIKRFFPLSANNLLEISSAHRQEEDVLIRSQFPVLEGL